VPWYLRLASGEFAAAQSDLVQRRAEVFGELSVAELLVVGELLGGHEQRSRERCCLERAVHATARAARVDGAAVDAQGGYKPALRVVGFEHLDVPGKVNPVAGHGGNPSPVDDHAHASDSPLAGEFAPSNLHLADRHGALLAWRTVGDGSCAPSD
jgi:hypothetical protein